MKRLYITLTLSCLMPVLALAEDSFHQPFQGLDADRVSRIDIAVEGVTEPIKIENREWITRFLNSISPKDYPVSEGPMTFSLPPEVAKIRLLGKQKKELVETTLYGAWNLMLSGTGDSHVLGSSKKTAALVLAKIEDAHPEKLKAWRKKFGDQLSGVYETEYRDILKSEQDAALNDQLPARAESGAK
ncbi:hypothetical protein [Haloferula sp.]|uniref:hypothetical protein n=1 Tax=Haloferula sp. TaxID=2497595 RepID=UPI0032A06B44